MQKNKKITPENLMSSSAIQCGIGQSKLRHKIYREIQQEYSNNNKIDVRKLDMHAILCKQIHMLTDQQLIEHLLNIRNKP